MGGVGEAHSVVVVVMVVVVMVMVVGVAFKCLDRVGL